MTDHPFTTNVFQRPTGVADGGLNRRRFLRGLGLAGAAAALTPVIAACGGDTPAGGTPTGGAAAGEVEQISATPDLIAAAQKEGSLFLRFGDPIENGQEFAKAFTAKYGIAVQLDRKVGVVGNQAFEQEEQAGKHIMDVNLSADPPGLERLAASGHYLRYALADVDALGADHIRLANIGYSYTVTEVCIQYNPTKISTADAVQLFSAENWNGLLDPALQGKVGFTEPAGGGVPFGLYLMFLRNEKYGQGFLEKLGKSSPQLYSGSAPGREALAAGTLSVFATGWTSIAMTNFLSGDQTRWTYPADMVPQFSVNYMGISKQAPHPNAARLFAAWFLSNEGQEVVQKSNGAPARPKATEARPAVPKLKETDWWKPFPTDLTYIPDVDDWGANYDKLIPEMRRALGYQQ